MLMFITFLDWKSSSCGQSRALLFDQHALVQLLCCSGYKNIDMFVMALTSFSGEISELERDIAYQVKIKNTLLALRHASLKQNR